MWCAQCVADRPAFPEPCCARPSGGSRGLFGGSFRGHELVCHPRQEGDHHAQGHPAGQENKGGEGVGCLTHDVKKTQKKSIKNLGFF
jgi:hypothetical protein